MEDNWERRVLERWPPTACASSGAPAGESFSSCSRLDFSLRSFAASACDRQRAALLDKCTAMVEIQARSKLPAAPVPITSLRTAGAFKKGNARRGAEITVRRSPVQAARSRRDPPLARNTRQPDTPW